MQSRAQQQSFGQNHDASQQKDGRREWAQTQPAEKSVQVSRIHSTAPLNFNTSLRSSGPWDLISALN